MKPGWGEREVSRVRKRRQEPCYSLSSCAPTGASAHTNTHTHQPREGGRAGLRSRGGRARKGETKEVGGHTHRLSLSCPLSHNPGAPAGTGREGTS